MHAVQYATGHAGSLGSPPDKVRPRQAGRGMRTKGSRAPPPAAAWSAGGRRRARLEHDGHVEVAQVEAHALQVDDVDLGHRDHREWHLQQLHLRARLLG